MDMCAIIATFPVLIPYSCEAMVMVGRTLAAVDQTARLLPGTGAMSAYNPVVKWSMYLLLSCPLGRWVDLLFLRVLPAAYEPAKTN